MTFKSVSEATASRYFGTLAKLMAGLLAISASFAWAEAGSPPVKTDDPGTPGDGNWEINVISTFHRTRDEKYIEAPLFDINYGIGDRVQLKVEMPWVRQTTPDSGTAKGTGNVLSGVKWRFYDAGEDGLKISAYPQVELRAPKSKSQAKGLVDTTPNYLLPFEFEYSLGDYEFNVEVGRWFRHENDNDSWFAGFVLSREISKGLNVMVELYDESTKKLNAHAVSLNFGVHWEITHKYGVMASIGRDLHPMPTEQKATEALLGFQFNY